MGGAKVWREKIGPIRRFDPCLQSNEACLEENENGMAVLYSDYAIVDCEVNLLRMRIKELEKQLAISLSKEQK